MPAPKPKLDELPGQKVEKKANSSKVITKPKTRAVLNSANSSNSSNALSGQVVTPGRPTMYSQDLADLICGLLAEGKSLSYICKADQMPALRTVFQWLRIHETFAHNYARAKVESADALFEDILDTANDVYTGKLDPNAGRVVIDAKKWAASKLKPKVYGDRIDVTSGGEKLPAPLLGGISVNLDGDNSQKVLE